MNISREIKDEDNPAKIGLIVSSIIIIGSLVPDFSSSWFSISNQHNLPILSTGLFMFMLFMGIKVNMFVRFERIDGIMRTFDVLPHNYTKLSKSFFWLAGLFLILSIILLIFGF